MPYKIVRACAKTLALYCAQILLCFMVLTSISYADWNSGITIEDVSTRIAINIVDEGVHVTVVLTDSAINQIDASIGISFDIFSQKVIKLVSKTELEPSINNAPPSSGKYFFPFLTTIQPDQLEIIPDFELIKKVGKQYILESI